MYKVNFAYKKTYISPACTSVPQGWNKGTRRGVEPKQINNLVFYKDKKTKEDSARDDMDNLNLKNQFDPRKPQDRQLTNETVSSLINGIIQKISISLCALLHTAHKR